MSRAWDLLAEGLKQLGPRPGESAKQSDKKRYSERLSERVAHAFAEELRLRGLEGTRPALPGDIGRSGAERRMAGGIGAKKVDVTYATEESGLLVAISIKSINFADEASRNFQKNLTNRRGDMLFEAVTLHRRFPYAVLAGFFFFDDRAATDDTGTRKSTFRNAHDAFRLFTNRTGPSGPEEQFERFYVVLHNADPTSPAARVFAAGDPDHEVPLEQVFDELISIIGERNSDLYEPNAGTLRLRGSRRSRRR